MAILPDVPGLTVEITVNGEPLKEYEDNEEEPPEPRTVTKYIEAVSGADFAMKVSFAEPFPVNQGAAIQAMIDGKVVDRPVISKHRMFKAAFVIDASHLCEGEDKIKRTFHFSELTINDDGTPYVSKELLEKLKSLGQISVSVFRLSHVGQDQKEHRRTGERDLLAIGAIAEKALKGRALSHQASLGKAQKTTWITCKCTFIDSAESPYAKVCFNYRSMAALKALCIIPRTPEPVPLEERAIEDLSRDEMMLLLNRQREQEASASKIKQEGRKQGIKRERGIDGSRVGKDESDSEIEFVSQGKRQKLSNRQPGPDDEIIELD